MALVLMASAGEVHAQSLTATDTSDVRFINGRKFYYYKVAKGETLFSISQKFKIPQEELIELNPGLKGGLKNKMKLWIPAYSWKGKDVSPVETDSKSTSRKESKELSVAIISSLDLGKVYVGDRSEGDSAASKEYLDRQTISNLEFVEGVLLALKDLHKDQSGLKIRASVIDTENDTARMNRYSWKPEVRQADIIITNESGHMLKTVNRFSRKTGAILVSCGINTSDSVRNNPHAVAVLPSSALQCRKMGEYSARQFKNASVVLVKTGLNKEIERLKAFREGWKSVDDHGLFRTSDYGKGYSKAVVDSLRKGRKNIIFLPSSNEDLVTTLLTALKDVKEDYDITVIGLPTWYNFETVDPALLQHCNVYFFNAGSIEPNEPSASRFRKNFREAYASEPGEAAFISYDATRMAVGEFRKSGNDGFIKSGEKTYKGIFTDYKLERSVEGDCLENQHIIIWSFKDRIPVKVTE